MLDRGLEELFTATNSATNRVRSQTCFVLLTFVPLGLQPFTKILSVSRSHGIDSPVVAQSQAQSASRDFKLFDCAGPRGMLFDVLVRPLFDRWRKDNDGVPGHFPAPFD